MYRTCVCVRACVLCLFSACARKRFVTLVKQRLGQARVFCLSGRRQVLHQLGEQFSREAHELTSEQWERSNCWGKRGHDNWRVGRRGGE
jgi:hypothetical protein